MTHGTLVRRAVAAACLLALTVVDSDAFKVDIHADITREALDRFASEALVRLANTVPADKRELFRSGFSTSAIEEIVNGNKAMDTGDCGNVPDPLRPGPQNPDMAAVPCTTFGSENFAAFEFLSQEPPEEHFDREKIQEGSDRIVRVTAEIRDHLINGRYTAARRLAGGVLHSIQDFYAHTNWVELGFTDQFERRLGLAIGSFSDGSLPRIATPADPTCMDGQRVFTDLTEAEQKELVAKKLDPLTYWQRLSTGRFLTSGYFFIWYATIPGSWADDPEISITNKCRHGYQVPNAAYQQPGINKDDPTRRGHAQARRLAVADSGNYLARLFNDPVLRGQGGPKFVDMMLGFMGHATKIIDISSFSVGVPGAPNGDSWDTAIGGVPRLFFEGINGIKNIQPDIYVCLESANLPLGCAAVCNDADWKLETNPPAYVCAQSVIVRTEANLRVWVREVDFGQPRRVIADFRIEDASKCNETYTGHSVAGTTVSSTTGGDLPVARPDTGACRLQLDADRSIWVQFAVKEAPAQSQSAPQAPRTGPAPPSAPGAGAGASVPQLPPVAPPQRTPLGPPPPIIPMPETPPPGTPLPPAGPSTALPPATGPNSTGPGTTGPNTAGPGTVGPGTTTALTPRTPTAAEIDAILNLRDANACTGSDAFVPPGTSFIESPFGQQLGQARAAQLYQMAAFAMAIADPAVKAKVLSAIQSRVGDDAFFGAMTQVIGDVQQSRALVAAYQALAQNVVSRVTATGLDRLLTPPRAAVADVGAWVLKMLTSDALVSNAVGMMSAGPSSALSAECTLNELAKDGFAATVGAR